MIVTFFSDVGSGELGIETGGLETAGVLLSLRARAALNFPKVGHQALMPQKHLTLSYPHRLLKLQLFHQPYCNLLPLLRCKRQKQRWPNKVLHRYSLPDLLLKEIFRRLVSRSVGVVKLQRSQVGAQDSQQWNWTKHLT